MTFFLRQKTEDYWIIQAQERIKEREMENEQDKILAQNQKEWSRRLNEGGWLLEGVKKVDDQDLSAMGTFTELDKHEKYALQLADLSKDFHAMKRREQEAKEKKKQQMAEQSTFSFKAMREAISKVFKTNETQQRVRDDRFVMKERIAEKLLLRNSKNERLKFLKDNGQNIRVLQNIRLRLDKARLPRHDVSAPQAISDYDGHALTPEQELEISQLNLRKTAIVDRELVPRRRLYDEAPLRSIKDIQREEYEGSKFRVSHLYHQFLGIHKLYPLRFEPRTYSALHSHKIHPEDQVYPEDKLLPNQDELKRLKHEEAKRIKKIKEPIKKLAKSHFDLSRRQFKYFQPTEIHNVTDSQLTTSIISQHIGISKQRNNDRDHKNDEEEDKNNNNIRYSTEFNWKKRDVIEENSVYRRRHVTVEFHRNDNNNDDNPATVEVSGMDESTISSSMKLYLIKSTDDMNSSLNNRIDGSIEGSYAPSVINTESLSNRHELDSTAFEAPVVDGFESIDAVRSNYVSEYSTKQDERIIPLRFARYRKAKHLSHYRVKGELKLESRKGKLNRQAQQKVMRIQEKKMREDELFVNAIQ